MADDLLEREPQRAAMEAALRAARHGDGGVLVIEAPAGLGKSRLLQELRGSATGTMRVLTARAAELEQNFAFGVVRQLFEALVRDPESAGSATDGIAEAALAVFDEEPGEAGATSFAILHGLHWLALNLADQRPLVLAVDDLHWCDSSSLRYLAYLARRLEGTPILLAATTRPVGREGMDGTLLGDIVAGPAVTHLDLSGLSSAATASLLAAQFGGPVEDAFAEACFEATDGNPLMLRQLARSLQSDGVAPVAAGAASVRRAAHRALSRTVLARVGRHSPAAITLARTVAVLGDAATLALATELSGLAEGELATAWTELARSEILRREPLAFVHALVRDAVYFDVPEHERARLHRRAADALAVAGGSLERVAGQLALTAPAGDAWAAGVLTDAAAAALRRGAPDAAVSHLRRAAAEPPPAELQRRVDTLLAEALFDVDAAAAAEHLRRLVAGEPDRDLQAELTPTLRQALALTDRWDEADAFAREAIAHFGDDHPQERAMLEAVRAVIALFDGKGADSGAFEVLTPHRTLAPGAGWGERLRAGEASLIWAYAGGSAAECADLADAGIGNDPSILRDHALVAVGGLQVLGLADRDSGLLLWQRAREEANRNGSIIQHLAVGLWLGITQYRRGALTEARALLTDSLELGTHWGCGEEPLRYNRVGLAHTLLEASGDVTAARAVLGAPPPADHSSLGALMWWHALGWAELQAGRPADALAAADTLERLGDWVAAPIGIDWWQLRAVALHRSGQTGAALEQAERSLAMSEQWGAPRTLGAALRIRGELRGQDGLPDLQRAVEVLDGTAPQFELARTLAALGGALRRAGQPSSAREPLERAHELARACGSEVLADAVRTELAASGVKRVAGDASGAGALTPSERRVADLAASGRTNREIAQELFVTPKTVEVHLSSAYRKLGIASRHALAGALAPA